MGTKKLTYEGPDGFAVAGQTLATGETVELETEQAKQLENHPWFGGTGVTPEEQKEIDAATKEAEKQAEAEAKAEAEAAKAAEKEEATE